MLWVSGARRSDGAMFKKKKKVTILFRLCERRRSDGRTQPGGFFLLIQIQKGPRLFVAVIFSSFFQFSAFRNQQSSSPKFHMRTTRTKYYIYDYFLKKDWSPSCKVSSALISGGGITCWQILGPLLDAAKDFGCTAGSSCHLWKSRKILLERFRFDRFLLTSGLKEATIRGNQKQWGSKSFLIRKQNAKQTFFLGE